MPSSLKLFLKLAVSLGLLALIFSAIPIGEMTASLRAMRPWLFVAAVALMPGMFYLAARQTKILTDQQGLTLSVGQIFRTTFATVFYGLLLPGTVAGGAIRWYKFSQQDKKPAQAFASIVFARLIDASVMTGAGLVFWALDAEARHNALYGIVLGAVFVGLCAIGLLFFRQRPAPALTSWLARQKLVPELIARKVAKVLRAAAEFGGLRGLTILRMAGVYVLYHLLGTASFFLLAEALALDVSFVSIGWIRTYIFLVSTLPISFLGIGVRDGALIVMLQIYGVPPATAVAYSFLILARRLVIAAVGGIIELAQFLTPARMRRVP